MIALALGEPVRDDRVAVQLVVVRPGLMPSLTPAAIGVEVRLKGVDRDGGGIHFDEVGGFALNTTRVCLGRYGVGGDKFNRSI
jgi:hypothetical protein